MYVNVREQSKNNPALLKTLGLSGRDFSVYPFYSSSFILIHRYSAYAELRSFLQP